MGELQSSYYLDIAINSILNVKFKLVLVECWSLNSRSFILVSLYRWTETSFIILIRILVLVLGY